MNPLFSFIIPSFNGAQKLPQILSSIFGSNKTSFEAIVVLDGSIDNSLEAIAPFRQNRLKVLEQENAGRSIARNNGYQAAEGQYLFFVDDDMRLSNTCLEAHALHHVQHPNSILVGKVEMDKSLFGKDFDDYLSDLYTSWEKTHLAKGRLTIHNFKFTTAHLSLPSSLFKKLGGFDLRLTDAEDYDFGMRALQAGIAIYYDPSIIAWHDDFPTCAKYIRRQIEYKKSHEKLRDIGTGYDNSLFLPLQRPTTVLKIVVLKLLALPSWVKGVDGEWLTFLPKKWRHKLYASIIYAHTLKGLGLI